MSKSASVINEVFFQPIDLLSLAAPICSLMQETNTFTAVCKTHAEHQILPQNFDFVKRVKFWLPYLQ